MGPQLILIESHEKAGVEWGLSTDGPNPTAENYIRCRDEGHARFVQAMSKQGILTPFLIAAGATVKTITDAYAEAQWRNANGYR